jgi:hypothetical protein
MKKNSKKKFLDVITYVVALLLLVGIVSAAIYYYDDVNSMFDDHYTSFSIHCNDVAYSSELSDVTFPFDSELRFDVIYTWARFAMSKDNSYTVKVVPCTNFDFTIDDNIYAFAAEEDITAAFNVNQEKDYFTMTIPGGVSVVLQSIYPSCEIVLPELSSYDDYYSLIVTASDGAELIKISFKHFSPVESVELSPAELRF